MNVLLVTVTNYHGMFSFTGALAATKLEKMKQLKYFYCSPVVMLIVGCQSHSEPWQLYIGPHVWDETAR